MGEYKVIPKNEMQTREWLMAHLNDYDDLEDKMKVVLGEGDDDQ